MTSNNKSLENTPKKAGSKKGVKKERHGDSYTTTYKTWLGMKGRCTNDPRHPSYDDYAGRGIKVCDRWLNSYTAFKEDMGEKPEGMTLDRWPENDGNYEPGNCRWATYSQQALNRREQKASNRKTHQASYRRALLIRVMYYNLGYTQSEIADLVDMSQGTVSGVVSNRLWKTDKVWKKDTH